MKFELHLNDEEIYYLLTKDYDYRLKVMGTNEIVISEVQKTLDFIIDQIRRQWESKRK